MEVGVKHSLFQFLTHSNRSKQTAISVDQLRERQLAILESELDWRHSSTINDILLFNISKILFHFADASMTSVMNFPNQLFYKLPGFTSTAGAAREVQEGKVVAIKERDGRGQATGEMDHIIYFKSIYSWRCVFHLVCFRGS